MRQGQGRQSFNRQNEYNTANHTARRSVRYINGNTIREIDVRTAILEEPDPEHLYLVKAQQRRNSKLNGLYILFLSVALFTTGFVLISYLQQQAELTTTMKRISAYEKQLNNLTLANDDEYSKMVNAIDLNEIRRIAIEDLGMVYAEDGQKITYERENSDYVRQMADLPD